MSYNGKRVLLSAAFAIASAFSASAADLYGGGSFKDAPVMAPMPAPSAGWYVRLDGGGDFATAPDIEVPGFVVKSKMDDGFVLGGGIGRYFGRGFRGDLTIDHIFDEKVTGDVFNPCGCYEGEGHFNFRSTVFLANLYYDFNRGGRFVPYIGAGIGFAHNETSQGVYDPTCGCDSKIAAGSGTHFAAAAMAGLAWKIRGGESYSGGLKGDVVQVSQNPVWLDVGYRFLYLGDVKTGDLYDNSANVNAPVTGVDPEVKNLMSHEIRVGIRYGIN